MALVSLGLGIALLVLSRYVAGTPDLDWLALWPISEIGGTLVAAGLFAIVWDYVDGKDKEARADERIRRLLRESAPAFRDAVVEGFAVNSDDHRRVASPELLDSIATNVLALRLGDRQFAEELYTEIRDQTIRGAARWYDASVSIRLSSIGESSATGPTRFAVMVKWEYSTTPDHPVQRFACVSDRDEFHELVADVPATSTWSLTPRPGFEASRRDAFELLEFKVTAGELTSTYNPAGRLAFSVGAGQQLKMEPVTVTDLISKVSGTATDTSGNPLKNILVRLTATDRTISKYWSKTSSTGRFTFRHLRSGNHLVRFDDPKNVWAFQYADGAVRRADARVLKVVAGNNVTDVNVDMKSLPKVKATLSCGKSKARFAASITRKLSGARPGGSLTVLIGDTWKTVRVVKGKAKVSFTNLPAGTQTVTATYSGTRSTQGFSKVYTVKVD